MPADAVEVVKIAAGVDRGAQGPTLRDQGVVPVIGGFFLGLAVGRPDLTTAGISVGILAEEEVALVKEHAGQPERNRGQRPYARAGGNDRPLLGVLKSLVPIALLLRAGVVRKPKVRPRMHVVVNLLQPGLGGRGLRSPEQAKDNRDHQPAKTHARIPEKNTVPRPYLNGRARGCAIAGDSAGLCKNIVIGSGSCLAETTHPPVPR